MTVSGQSTHSSGLMFEKDLALAATGKESKQTKAHPGQTNKQTNIVIVVQFPSVKHSCKLF